MKVVKQKSTEQIVYIQKPEFEDGKGILNASIIYKIPLSDLIEANVLQNEIDSYMENKKIKEDEKNVQKNAYNVAKSDKERVEAIAKFLGWI